MKKSQCGIISISLCVYKKGERERIARTRKIHQKQYLFVSTHTMDMIMTAFVEHVRDFKPMNEYFELM